MRAVLVMIHRWLGLATAAFLFIAGATGAVISWDHELDEWLNPALYRALTPSASVTPVTPLPPLALAARAEQADPRVRVTFMPLAVEPGRAFTVSVAPRIDPATGEPFEVGYNQVALDPASGQVQARREWGKASLTREHLLPFLYKLHYSLHVPDGWGIEFGVWFMGLVGIAWLVDTLVALAIAFTPGLPRRRSFALRWRAGGHRLTFDLHRAGALWVYALLLMLAVTSIAMNLREQVVRPVVSWFSPLTPSPFAERTPAPPQRAIEPAADAASVLRTAAQEAARRGIAAPAGGLFLSTAYGLWGVGFYPPGRAHGDGGLGNPWLYFDARTGEPVGADIPGAGSAGDLFLQSMFPLHSGRVLGTPGRVLMSIMGLVVAALSVTGVMIWARKRAARVRAVANAAARGALAVP